MRAVLDANVFVSALLSPHGAPAQIVSRWLSGEFELIASELLLAEVERALAYPKIRRFIEPADAKEFVDLLRETAMFVPDPPPAASRSPDPGDEYLLALAEAERAAVVSGDQHLLGLAEDFPIFSPRAFLHALETQR